MKIMVLGIGWWMVMILISNFFLSFGFSVISNDLIENSIAQEICVFFFRLLGGSYGYLIGPARG